MKQQQIRLRHIKAGLDNAVVQASERKFENLYIIDADCHENEPFALLSTYVDARYKKLLAAADAEMISEGSSTRRIGVDVSRFKRLGKKETRDGHSVRHGPRKRPEGLNRSPEETISFFADRVHDLGIRKSILFPTSLLSAALNPNKDYELALTKAYARYVVDHFSGKQRDIFNPLMVPVNSPEKAAELIDTYGSEKGIVGVMVPSVGDHLAGTDHWNPIYEAAQDHGLPICMHGVNYNSGDLQDFDKFIGMFTLARPMSLARQVTSVVLGGVPERFPKLKFAFIEGGVTWVPWLMQRLDSVYVERKDEAPLLTKMPSEYMKGFYYTTQPLEYTSHDDLDYTFKKMGAENNLMYASDYPHWDFDLPSVVYDLPFLSDRARRRIMGENAMEFFKLER